MADQSTPAHSNCTGECDPNTGAFKHATDRPEAGLLVTAEACSCRFAPVSAWWIVCEHDGMHRPGECTGVDCEQAGGAVTDDLRQRIATTVAALDSKDQA